MRRRTRSGARARGPRAGAGRSSASRRTRGQRAATSGGVVVVHRATPKILPGLGGGQTVDAPGEVQVTLRQSTGRVGAEGEPHLVPAVHEDVRLVVRGL